MWRITACISVWGDYDPNYKLFIDPVIVGSTNIGATVMTFGHSATFDQFGNIIGGGAPFRAGIPNGYGLVSNELRRRLGRHRHLEIKR